MKSPVVAELERLTHLYKKPPDGFDPLKATDRELIELGLPSKPTQADEPEAFAFWTILMSEPLQFIQPEFRSIMPRDASEFVTSTFRAPATNNRQAHRMC